MDAPKSCAEPISKVESHISERWVAFHVDTKSYPLLCEQSLKNISVRCPSNADPRHEERRKQKVDHSLTNLPRRRSFGSSCNPPQYRRAGIRDEPLRRFAWEAILLPSE